MPKMNVISVRKISYISSIALVLISLLLPFIVWVNPGIDMTGWVQIEYDIDATLSTENIEAYSGELQGILKRQYDNEINSSVFTLVGEDTLRAEIWLATSDEESEKVKSFIREQVPAFLTSKNLKATEIAYTNIGDSFGDYVRTNAFTTLRISLILLAIYISYAFRRKDLDGTLVVVALLWLVWLIYGFTNAASIGTILIMDAIMLVVLIGYYIQYKGSSYPFVTVITLAHDVIISAWLYIFLGSLIGYLQFDTYTVTALLTILGYSINDTIVILDRVRTLSNDKKIMKKLTEAEVLNRATSESFRRSLFTSLTLVIVLIVMLLSWLSAIAWFVVVLLIGTIVGTYSSLFIAAPLVYDLWGIRQVEQKKFS